MTATATEAPDAMAAVDKLTDDAIKAEIKKLNRMIASRQEDISELNHEIVQYQARRDQLIEAQIQRLKAQLTPTAE